MVNLDDYDLIFPHLEYCYQRPKQSVKVGSRDNLLAVLILERVFSPKQMHSQDTGREDEDDQQSQECHHIVHCVDHHQQLATQGRHEPHQLEYAQKAK